MRDKLPYIRRGHDGGMNFGSTTRGTSLGVLFAFLAVCCIFFTIIFLRLFQLTVVQGNHFKTMAEDNRIREIIIEPKRGTIIDRKGAVLAQNFPANNNSGAERITSRRVYEDPEVYAHLIGYRQIADRNDLEKDNCLNKLKNGFKTGKKGIEKLFECPLRGDYGKKLIEVDASGKKLETLTVIPPKDGVTLQLAVDANLQKKAYELIQGKKAVVVGLRPKTGEVLVLASSPSFDPQAFEDDEASTIRKYFTDQNKPLFNRATEGTYPPGSIFKLVLASGALQEKKIKSDTQFEDTGILHAGPITFGNWYFLEYGKTEGMVNIVKAIQRSNDIFFYQTGVRLGPEGIKKWAEILGYGKKHDTGLDESAGTVPSPFWKEDTLKELWYTGDTYNFSIGQGYLLATPMQVALSTAPFANGGYYCKPKLLKVGPNSNLSLSDDLRIYTQPECEKIPLSSENLKLIQEGMTKACTTGGTGWPLFDFKVKIGGKDQPIQTACKTGTAESTDSTKIPYAWITVYAPADPTTGDPEIVLTVLVEEGGQGSDVAGPIARDILKTYFESQQ